MEFALPASSAPVAQPVQATRRDKQPFQTSGVSVKTTREPFNDGQKIAPSRASPAAAKVADEYRAKTFELMTANINSTLEYAQRLAKAKTPAEFGDLSMNQARKTFELIIKQTAELASIAQRLATFTVRRMSPVK